MSGVSLGMSGVAPRRIRRSATATANSTSDPTSTQSRVGSDASESGVNDSANAGDASTRPVMAPAAIVLNRRTILRRDMIESSNQHDDGTMVAGRTRATDRRQFYSPVG